MIYLWDKVISALSEMYPVPEPTARDKWFRERGMLTDNERAEAARQDGEK